MLHNYAKIHFVRRSTLLLQGPASPQYKSANAFLQLRTILMMVQRQHLGSFICSLKLLNTNQTLGVLPGTGDLVQM
jgi:hypothetical protein